MKKDKTTTRIIQATVLIFGLLIAVSFSFGMYSGIVSHTGTNKAIIKTLEKECDCEAIDVAHAAYGLQISKKDGMTTDRATFNVTDCKLRSSVKETMHAVHNELLKNVEGYKKMDRVAFSFNQDGTRDVIVVKNGQIQ